MMHDLKCGCIWIEKNKRRTKSRLDCQRCCCLETSWSTCSPGALEMMRTSVALKESSESTLLLLSVKWDVVTDNFILGANRLNAKDFMTAKGSLIVDDCNTMHLTTFLTNTLEGCLRNLAKHASMKGKGVLRSKLSKRFPTSKSHTP